MNKSGRKFSAIAIDQCHEQHNAHVKGAVGLTGDGQALHRWMVAGPEVARVIKEFEEEAANVSDVKSKTDNHHEQYAKVQSVFLDQVQALTRTIEEMGNPFMEHSDELLRLHTRDIMDDCVKDTVRKVVKVGQDQYNIFVDERLMHSQKAVTDPLPRNKLVLFKTPRSKAASKKQTHLSEVKNDCNLFSRLYVACQTRDGDLDTFFSHENQPAPPSLSQGGELRQGTKSNLLTCLETHQSLRDDHPTVEAKMFDGGALVHMLRPITTKTFHQYAEHIFVPYIIAELQGTNRVDLIWDAYLPNSLKDVTRRRRGTGMRRRVSPNTAIPRNWKDFLCVDENKEELSNFLSTELMAVAATETKEVYASNDQGVLCSSASSDLQNLTPCLHEEADTRIFVHVAVVREVSFHVSKYMRILSVLSKLISTNP